MDGLLGKEVTVRLYSRHGFGRSVESASAVWFGIFRIASPADLFSGFASPALFTVAIVLVMSAGIVESGIFSGFGRAIAARVKSPVRQLFAVFLSTSMLSAFMNNVGAVGIMLPTSKRMARRAGQEAADFGMPLAYASILGGSVTLIGTASNLIVSTFRFQSYGAPFRMFDFTAHGIVIVFTGVIVLFICRICGLGPSMKKSVESISYMPDNGGSFPDLSPARSKKNNAVVLFTLIPAVIAAAGGMLHPSIGFGMTVILWLAFGVLSGENAVSSIHVPVILFLGSMLSLSSILDHTGALTAATDLILPLTTALSPFPLILLITLFTALLANMIDNAVAAVIMAPLMIRLDLSELWQPGCSADGCGGRSQPGHALPTHQAAIVSMESTQFSEKLIRTAQRSLPAAILASAVIYFVWSLASDRRKCYGIQTNLYQGLAHCSYVIGGKNQCIVVDPARDVEPYMKRPEH